MRNSRSSFELKGQEEYSQIKNRNQSRSNSPKFHLQELNSNEMSKQRHEHNLESPSDHKFTLQDNSNQYYNEMNNNNNNNNNNNVYNSGAKTRKIGSSIENIAPHSSYSQLYNNQLNNISPLQGNTADQSMISQRGGGSMMEREAPQSKAYISAMKALQEKVKILERKYQESQSLHTSELESIRQEKIQLMSQSSSKKLEFEDRAKQFEYQISQIKEESEKQMRVFKQLENNLMEKLKEAEKDNREVKDREQQYQNEIKEREKEIVELREQLKMQGESKLAERQQLKQKISELTLMLKEMEGDKESFKKKIDFLEKQFVQYEKDLVIARNDTTKEHYIKQLQDQLYQQADYHERERIDQQIQHKMTIEQYEKDLIQCQDKIAFLIKENDRLYFDWKLSQDQLVIISQEKNDSVFEIQKLLAEIHNYQEKSRHQENESKTLQDLADQSRKINQQLLESLQKSNTYQPQLRLSDLQSSQVNPLPLKHQKIQMPYEDAIIDDNWQNEATPLKNIHMSSQNIPLSDPYYNHFPPRNYHLSQQDQPLAHSLSANRFSNSQRMPSRSASHRRLPNLTPNDINRNSNLEEGDIYSTTQIINTSQKYQKPEKSPLRNQTIRFKEQEYQQANDSSPYKGSQLPQSNKEQIPIQKPISRNRSIDSTIRQSKGSYQDFHGYSDQNIYEEHYKRIVKEKESKKIETLEEIDDLIQQILQCEKEIIQLTAEKMDLEQEIQVIFFTIQFKALYLIFNIFIYKEFNGEKIYIDMLRIRLDNVKDKIKKKTDTVSYLKRKEQELNKVLKE